VAHGRIYLYGGQRVAFTPDGKIAAVDTMTPRYRFPGLVEVRGQELYAASSEVAFHPNEAVKEITLALHSAESVQLEARTGTLAARDRCHVVFDDEGYAEQVACP
jgi:hypothetical protein